MLICYIASTLPFITIMNKSLECVFIRLISIFHFKGWILCLWFFFSLYKRGKSGKITDYTQKNITSDDDEDYMHVFHLSASIYFPPR